MASAGGERMSTSDFKRKRELDEARKNGTLPPEQDADGNLINPHNPEYISKRPWYLGDSGPSLKHQSIQNKSHVLSIHEADDLHLRGRKASPAASTTVRTGVAAKWRKGACKNCGAQSHKTTECVERPRKVGAWKTQRDVQRDDVLVDVRSQQFGKLTFDAKRDQWLGYDPREHAKTIARYDKIDDARKKLRMDEVNRTLQQQQQQQTSATDPNSSPTAKRRSRKTERRTDATDDASDSDSDYDSDLESEDEAFRDHDQGPMFTERVARQGGVGGAQMKVTVRNLRIREDTAKYLRNLNPNSAYYDPKTRSMRDNPNPELHADDTTFTGDNAVRFTGDAQRLATAQLFAWEAYAKGTDIHPLANPSQAEFLKQQFEAKKAALERDKARKILDKYGGQQHLAAPPKELLLAQTEHYVEYARDGRVVHGLERAPVKSKYVEDVLENNHRAIWGSWFDRTDRAWGYACCHAKVRKSYCTGDDGKRALEDAARATAERALLPPLAADSAAKRKGETDSSSTNNGSGVAKRSELYGENIAPALDDRKLKRAIKKAAKERARTDALGAAAVDDRSRTYNSMADVAVNAEDMEAYKLLRTRGDDPMAKLLGDSDALLDDDNA